MGPTWVPAKKFVCDASKAIPTANWFCRPESRTMPAKWPPFRPGRPVVVPQGPLDRFGGRVLDEVDLDALGDPALERQAEAERQDHREPVDPEEPGRLAVELTEPGDVEPSERVVVGHASFILRDRSRVGRS